MFVVKNLFRIRYDKLINSGMFWEFYPQLSGIWQLDCDEFIKNETWLDKNIRNK